MPDPWPEPTDEELPDDTLPGGPEDDEPDQAASTAPRVADCGLLLGPGGSEFRYIPAAGTGPHEVQWTPPGGSYEVVEVKVAADGTVLAEKDGDRWWRFDYDKDRAGPSDGRWKVSKTHGMVVAQHFDGVAVKKWIGTVA